MNNLLGPIIGAILGGILGFIFAYLLLVLRERHAKRKLEYEKVSTLSLISMDERIRRRIKVLCDNKPTNNIFSFKFRIANTGKAHVERIPILVEFNDKDTEILDIKDTFEVKDKDRKIELFLDKTNKYQGKFIIVPGLDQGEVATFDVFTKDNKTAELSSFLIKLGEEKALGIHWTCLKNEEMFPMWCKIGIGAVLGLSGGVAVFAIKDPEALVAEIMPETALFGLLGIMVGIALHFASKRLRQHD